MISLHPRRLLAISAALALVGSFVADRHFRRPAVDYCANPNGVMASSFLRGFTKRISPTYSLDSSQLGRIEGTHKNASAWRSSPNWSVSRSYALKHHGSRPRGLEAPFKTADDVTDEVLEVDGINIPVRIWVQRSPGHGTITASFYIYRGRPVSGFFWSALANSAKHLFAGDSPSTRVLIQGTASGTLESARKDAVHWLRSAWTRYAAVCGL